MAFFLGSWLFSATRCAAVLQRICNGFATILQRICNGPTGSGKILFLDLL